MAEIEEKPKSTQRKVQWLSYLQVVSLISLIIAVVLNIQSDYQKRKLNQLYEQQIERLKAINDQEKRLNEKYKTEITRLGNLIDRIQDH